MHSIEPYYYWRDFYIASEDPQSPFYEMVYSEFQFSNSIYDHYIHPQWDYFGSPTMYTKVLFADYSRSFAIIELIGEWNDCISNDIMLFKTGVIDPMLKCGIEKFIIIGENVLNFHGCDEDYYDEWVEDCDDGWISIINFQQHVLHEMQANNIDQYFFFNPLLLDDFNWRKYTPVALFEFINEKVMVPLLR